jgi:hypothetical protein
MNAGWAGVAGSVAAWLVVACTAAGYRRAARRGGVRPAAVALTLLGTSASAFTIVTALGLAYPGGDLGVLRYAAIVTGAVGIGLYAAAALSDPRGNTMRTVYKVLAYAVAALVVVQAMSIAWTVAGLDTWVQNGGVFDKSVMESDGPMPFPEVTGIIVHGINGGMLIPLVSLLLLISSFFAKIPGGIKFGAAVFVLVAIQATLGYAHLPITGLFHGGNALLLFATALYAARRVNGAVVKAGPAAVQGA